MLAADDDSGLLRYTLVPSLGQSPHIVARAVFCGTINNRRVLTMKSILASTLAVVLASSLAWLASLPPQVVELTSPFEEAGGNFGRAVDGIGDINSDGHSDLIVGADLEDVSGLSAAGRAYVFDGQSGDTLVSHSSPEPQSNGRYGGSVTGLSDVDNDGVRDYAVAAWNESEGSTTGVGHVYVYSGADHSLLYTIDSPEVQLGANFGAKIAWVSDISGDGVGDLLVGALAMDVGGVTDAGRAYALDGTDGSVVHSLGSPNPETNGVFGSWVAGVGDLDTDGKSEIAVGAFFEERDGSPFAAGGAYVFDGDSGSVLMTLHSTNEVSDGLFGGYISAAGDLDADLVPDILVGARSEHGGDVDDGRVYAFSGATGDTLFTLISPNPEFEGLFGSVAPAGDVNLDGYDDFFVGAAGENGKAGRVYLFSGLTRDTLFSVESPNSDPGGVFGARLEGAGDVNNDGVLDVIVSATRDNPGSSPVDAGRAYVILVDTDGTVSVDDRFESPSAGAKASVTSHPNPFQEKVSIVLESDLPFDELKVTDLMGREIVSLVAEGTNAGGGELVWDGTDATGRPVADGIYFVVARFGERIVAAPMIRVQ